MDDYTVLLAVLSYIVPSYHALAFPRPSSAGSRKSSMCFHYYSAISDQSHDYLDYRLCRTDYSLTNVSSGNASLVNLQEGIITADNSAGSSIIDFLAVLCLCKDRQIDKNVESYRKVELQKERNCADMRTGDVKVRTRFNCLLLSRVGGKCIVQSSLLLRHFRIKAGWWPLLLEMKLGDTSSQLINIYCW